MKVLIFYAWQSKSRPTNQYLIQDATQLAIDRISIDEHQFDFVLDSDTQNIPGSPSVAETILSKIDTCSLFLCDLSLVIDGTSERPASPNPNVLIELGYAAARIGWQRIICVMNLEFGGPSKLPFDLKHRRWPIEYRAAKNADNVSISQVKDELSKDIEFAIRTALQSGIITDAINPKDRRVAIKFNGALSRFVGTFAGFLVEHGYEDGMKIILEDYPNAPASEYPAVDLVAPILKLLSQTSVKKASNVWRGDKSLSWAEVFVNELTNLCRHCTRILDQYSDRDDSVISLIDEINNRAEMLVSMITISLSSPSLASFYDEGIPEVHIEWFRYFLLTILKSYRIIRSFGVKVE